MHRGVVTASVQVDVWQLHLPLTLALPLAGPTETTDLIESQAFSCSSQAWSTGPTHSVIWCDPFLFTDGTNQPALYLYGTNDGTFIDAMHRPVA